MRAPNNGTLQSKRNILLQQAEDLASQRGIASAGDQLNLGNSYMFGNRYDLALNHFKAAVKATAETQTGRLNSAVSAGRRLRRAGRPSTTRRSCSAKPTSGQLG